MSNYYEVYVNDNSAVKVLRKTLLSISLVILLIALTILVFAFIATYWLMIPFGILTAISIVVSNIAHLFTRNYKYAVDGDVLIIQKEFAESYREINRILLSTINSVQMKIIKDATRYTPFSEGVTLMTEGKNYAISPDDYMLALIVKDKVVI